VSEEEGLDMRSVLGDALAKEPSTPEVKLPSTEEEQTHH
jgi:hypothetical protein